MNIQHLIDSQIKNQQIDINILSRNIDSLTSFKGRTRYYLEDLINLGIHEFDKHEKVLVDYNLLMDSAKHIIRLWNKDASIGKISNGSPMKEVNEELWLSSVHDKLESTSSIELGRIKACQVFKQEKYYEGRCLDHLYTGILQPYLYIPISCLYIEDINIKETPNEK